MDTTLNRAMDYSTVFLRFALGFSFLSAVADRFGLWGAYGQPHVAWGDFARFVAYTGKLNWFVPAMLIPALAWASTVAETLLGFALVVGLFTRIAALLSGMILLLFALAMTIALGIKAPLDFSVFSASAGAFLLAAHGRYPLCVDALTSRASLYRFQKEKP
ncbi:MAG: DoxX family protein [Verrucomicrobia bacterium]|nr:DoxX family protein [Verrucomicrobiota bacterium]